MVWLELCTTYSSSSPAVTTTSIILCFNEYRLTWVHVEKTERERERERLVLLRFHFLCLFVCRITQKSCRLVVIKLVLRLTRLTSYRPFHFGADPDHGPNPEIFKHNFLPQNSYNFVGSAVLWKFAASGCFYLSLIFMENIIKFLPVIF